MTTSMTPISEAPNAAPFPLLDDIVVLADAAMRAGEPAQIVQRLADGLRGLLADRTDAVPGWLLAGTPEGYVRRELHRASSGYQIVAITWPPGQGSPVHDHADTWGIEALLRGRLEVVDYRIVAQHRALAELRPAASHTLEPGTVLGLLPPHDLHACRNASARETAVTLHIYGRALETVKRYTEVGDGLYRPQRIQLAVVD